MNADVSAYAHTSMESSVTNQFYDFMCQHGLPPDTQPIADGAVHRFAAPGQKDKNAWYVFHGDYGAFGDWASNIKETWCRRTGGMSDEERKTLHKRIAEARRDYKEKERQKHEARAAELADQWDRLPLIGSSPYCEDKGVENFGCRYGILTPTTLVVPGYDIKRKLWTLQKIDAKGNKLFWEGARAKGCFHIIGADGLDGVGDIIVAEGYSTAASVHMATGKIVVVAFDASNLIPVIEAIRKKYPDLKITIAADDDIYKPDKGNKGREKAIEAANKYDCGAVFPTFQDLSTKPTDWNDLHKLEGLEAVARIITNVTAVTDVQGNNSADSIVTDDATITEDAVTPDEMPHFPKESECPCFMVFDDWHQEGKVRCRPGVWFFSVKEAKGDTPRALVPQWVCSPLHVEAITFDGQDNNFGRFLRLLNPLQRWREWAMPMELLRGSGEELRGELLAMGVEMAPQAKSLLSNYLQSKDPKRRMRCALQVGWCHGSFVLPDVVIGAQASDVIFQSGERGHDEYTCAGTLEGWKTGIAARAIRNPMLTMALSSSFAGPLLDKCNAESGGFHFVGDSATGKTGLTDAACSVWGGDNYKRSWRTTSNGMEGVSAMFNDGLLALDEISECDPREVGAIVYSLGNGRGKQRSSRTGNARGVKRWRCFVLSNGERSIETTMAEGGYRAKAGQSVRVPSVPVTRRFGVWDDLHGRESGAAFTDTLKLAAKHHHGYIGRAFLERLTRDQRDFCALWERTKALPEFSKQGGEGQDKRVAGRFALAAMAGELATEYGLTGWPQGAAINAAGEGLTAWRTTRSGHGNNEKEQILDKVSGFIERHGDGRFSDANSTQDVVKINDRAGWWSDENGGRVYLFTSDGMHEALKGFDFKRALDTLQEAGALSTANGERSKPQRIGGRLIRLYAIRAEKLDVCHEH